MVSCAGFMSRGHGVVCAVFGHVKVRASCPRLRSSACAISCYCASRAQSQNSTIVRSVVLTELKTAC